MIHQYKVLEKKISEVLNLEDANWIDISTPVKRSDFKIVSKTFSIPEDFFADAIDIDEKPRFEEDENHKLIVIQSPIQNQSQNKPFNESDATYITAPFCIIFSKQRIITVNAFEEQGVNIIFEKISKSDSYKTGSLFLLIYEKIIQNFLSCLKQINYQRNILEKKLYDASRNSELLELMRIQKSLVYFVTALRSNELLMLKIERLEFIKLEKEDQELLRDLIVDTSQALDMANIYTTILSSTLDAFASLISNNQNQVLKRLTSITIIIQLPVFIMTIYGMNVPIPYQHHPFAFYIPIVLSIFCSILIVYFFQKKRWF